MVLAEGQIQRRTPATMTVQRTRLGACTIVVAPVLRLRKNHCSKARKLSISVLVRALKSAR